MQCIMKRMVTIAMNQTNSGNTLTNGYHQSMFNTIIVVLLLGFCAVVATLHSLLTFYGSNTMARKNMMPLKNAKRQRWHVQRRRKPKESSSTVCVQLYYKKESTWYVYELKNTRCTIKCKFFVQFTIFYTNFFSIHVFLIPVPVLIQYFG